MWTNNENMVEFLTGDKTCTVSFTNRKYCNRMKKLHEKRPGDFEAFEVNADGSVYARIPLKWLKITPPAKRDFTEEQREAMRMRMSGINVGRTQDDEDDDE